MTKSLNISPYFDDYDPSKGYHKILFVPGNAVQARELTQIQSLIQEQIKRHGDHIFKNGTVVLPGQLYFDNDINYLKVDTVYEGVNVESYKDFLIGKTVSGGTSGVSGLIVHIEQSTSSDPTTIFFKYTAGNGEVSTFTAGETLTESTTGLVIKIQTVTPFSGRANICSIEEGVYYVNGFFVGVNKQTIAVSKYSDKESNVVGLVFNETIVGPETDSSLYDNSNGFSNFGAPGADRLRITLDLTSKPYDYVEDDGDTDLNFIELLKVKEGKLQYMVEDTEYSQINKMLARRTYDESGDYVVNPFSFKFRNYRSNNRGQWVESKAYLAGDVVSNANKYYYCRVDGYSGSTPPTHTYGTQSDGSTLWTQVTIPQLNNGVVVDPVDATLEVQRENETKFVVNVSPGKAYINGYEVNIREDNQVINTKARDVRQISDVSLFAPIGQYVIVDNLAGVIDTTTCPQLNIKDSGGNNVGTAYAKSLEYISGTVGTTAAQYRLFLFGLVMNTGKSFALNGVSFAFSTSFSAKVVQSTTQLTGLISTTAASATVTGKGTLFQSELSAGQLIKIGDETKLIANIASNVSLTVSVASGNTAFANTNTDVTGFEVTADMLSFGPTVRRMDNSYVKSIRDQFNQIDTQYTINRTIGFNVTGGSNSAAITLTSPGETFASTNPTDYIVTFSDNSIKVCTYSLNGSSTVLTVSGTLPDGAYKIIAKIVKQGSAALEKSKSLVTKTITVNETEIRDEADLATLDADFNFEDSVISLTEADVTKIIKITMSGGDVGVPYDPANEVDITSWYSLDNGQRSDFYDLGSIKIRPGQVLPKKPIKVTFEYFDHSAGDYFSVDSYKNIPYGQIPSTTLENVTYDLRDCLDFRSRKSDDGSGFTASGASISEPLNSTTSISTSYSHYLPRVDVMTVNQSGEFTITTGKPAINPTEPVVSGQPFKLMVMNVDPFTSIPENIQYKAVFNKRYTMSDVGKIDSRLKNVEYYVALNELEKKTAGQQIVDENGLNRFKNGFFSDNFSSYITSDISNPDYNASINPENNTLGPKSVVHNISLYEIDGTSVASRLANGYQITGSQITLPYTEATLVEQPSASRSEFINPYAVISFKNTGIAKVVPESDIWTDTQTDYNETWVAGSQIVTSQSVDYNYYYYYYYGYYGYYYGYWYGYGYGYDGWYGYGYGWGGGYTTTQTVGTQTSTVSKTETVKETDISTMRSRSVGLSIQGMKPFTSFHAFMDNQLVDSILKPCATLRYTAGTGKVQGWDDTSKTTESLSKRITTIGSYDSFDYGDVLTFYNGASPTGATAVVAARASQVVGGVDEVVLKLANIVGTINVGNTFTASVSSATGTVSGTGLTVETELVTNSVGNFYGVLSMSSQFTTGAKTFKFNDTLDGNTANANTEVKTTYTAHGTLSVTTINETKKTDTLVSQTTHYTPYYYWYGYYYYYYGQGGGAG
jgi:hypothetical protein